MHKIGETWHIQFKFYHVSCKFAQQVAGIFDRTAWKGLATNGAPLGS
jgi:hypothetical protein